MRHKNTHRKFGLEHKPRMAMLRNQVMSLIEHERITTTDAKAKEVRRIAEKVITLGKRGDVHARRLAFRTLRSRELIAKLFGPIAERYRTRPGGYTRILKLGNRVGDMAPVSILELLPDPNAPLVKAEDSKKDPKKAPKPKAKKEAHEAGDEQPKASKKSTTKAEVKPKAKKDEKAEGKGKKASKK